MSRRRSRSTVHLTIRLSPSAANELSRKGYNRFLKRHRTIRSAGRATKRGLKRAGHDVRRGAKRGTGYVYHKL